MEVVERLVSIASRDEGLFKTLLEDFKSLGARVASIVSSYYIAPSALEELLAMASIASKVSAFKEVKASRRGESLIDISIIGSWKTLEVSKLVEAFIRGAFETLGYNVKDVYVGVGSLKVTVEAPKKA